MFPLFKQIKRLCNLKVFKIMIIFWQKKSQTFALFRNALWSYLQIVKLQKQLYLFDENKKKIGLDFF